MKEVEANTNVGVGDLETFHVFEASSGANNILPQPLGVATVVAQVDPVIC